jgi:hypothetical protein
MEDQESKDGKKGPVKNEKSNSHENMPVENKATDTKKSTADEPGLNQQNHSQNELEPGIHPGDE